MDRGIIERSYDRFAARYDEIFETLQTPKIQGLTSALPRPLPSPVADLGCGTGLVTRVTGVRVVGVDLSRGMLQRAPGPWRVQADMNRLPFPDATFGLVFAVTSILDFGPDVPALREIARVLRPGGFAALSILKIEDALAFEAALARDGLSIETRLDLEQDLGFVCFRGSRPTPT